MLLDGFAPRTVDVGSIAIATWTAGDGPPLLLLHGYPQTHHLWHRVAPALAERFTVVATDLRGYGASAKPPGGDDHAAYAKRAMAADQVGVMAALGFTRFAVAGHDRGARVTHRMALDHPDVVTGAVVMDIAPTHHMVATTDRVMATAYFHWFFLAQPGGLPESMIGANPEEWVRSQLTRGHGGGEPIAPEALEEYLRAFRDPEAIAASCEDYRAAVTIDFAHDEADRARRVRCPLLVLWGDRGFVGHRYDMLGVWREYADDVRGYGLPCGHFVPEEVPGAVIDALADFLPTT